MKQNMSRYEVGVLADKYGLRNFVVNDDLTVDVVDNVNLLHKDLTELPLHFGKVSGSFNCSYNKLTTLEGCPSYVGGDFYCYNNDLTTLEGCPKHIVGDFWCSYNKNSSYNKISLDKIIFIGTCNKLLSNNLWKF